MPNFKEIRAQLEQANKVAAQLAEVANVDESLSKKAKANLSKAKEAAVLMKLAELPNENMKDASESTIRVETLRKFGITTVASVYHSSENQLERISGISRESAKELKFIADQMFNAVADSISYGVKIDSLTVDDLNLLENIQGLEGLRKTLRGNHTKIRPLSQSIQDSLKDAKPLKSRIQWIFAGSEKRNKALNAVANVAMVLGEPNTMMMANLAQEAMNFLEAKVKDAPVEDFKRRSSDYYSVLEDVSGVKTNTGNQHFDDELVTRIESAALDTSLLNATLRKYQVFGSKFALTQNRVILGDEMGLGKTMQALASLSQRSAEGATRFLIVCPASVLVNWQREIAQRTSLKCTKIHGDEQKTGLTQWKEFGGIGITTFDTLKAFEITDEEILHLNVDTIVVDEAHYVKNLETGRTKTIVRWLDRVPRVLFMTGTPLENRVQEFVNLAKLLDPKFAGRLSLAAMSSGVDAFKKHVAPMYLRRNSIEVLQELPELIQINEYCSWDGTDYDFYLKSVNAGNFMGMRRAGYVPLREGVLPNKLERIIELVDESFESGKKVIIFSYFKDVLELVLRTLGEKAMGPITGAVSSTRRQELVDSFTQSEKPIALLGQIQAAGTGLNIQAASVVILCEPQIKPSLEVQAIARAHRMGQVNSVQVHRMLISEGIDELMTAMLARKQTEFDDYARDSHLANSSVLAKDKTEEEMARVFVMEERKRLNIESNSSVSIEDTE